MKLSEAVTWCKDYGAKVYFTRSGVEVYVGSYGPRAGRAKGPTITKAVIALREGWNLRGGCNECGKPR